MPDASRPRPLRVSHSARPPGWFGHAVPAGSPTSLGKRPAAATLTCCPFPAHFGLHVARVLQHTCQIVATMAVLLLVLVIVEEDIAVLVDGGWKCSQHPVCALVEPVVAIQVG